MDEKPVEKSWLEERLRTLDAIYQKFGAEGLKGHSLADVRLLITAKELEFRDAPKGGHVADAQKAENRQLELQIKDLGAFVNAQLAGANLPTMNTLRQFQANTQQQSYKPKQKNIEMER